MGRGTMINTSKKLGVVTTSSTETEVVACGERFPKCTWFRYFRLAQGANDKEDILFQDNKSAILLQKKHPFSIGRGSKHIHVRYYFVVDKVENKELKIIYCPTEEMIADYSTKPTQGALFTYQRNVILGVKEEEFNACKMWYKRKLEEYDLWDDDKKDLMDL